MIDDDDFYTEEYHDLDEYLVDGVGFAQEGSALRAETKDNPRNLPCPTCHWPNRLTPIDKARGYQCDSCANALERGTDIDYYEPPSYTVVMTVQVDVEAESEEEALKKAQDSTELWVDWNVVDSPVTPEVVNKNP